MEIPWDEIRMEYVTHGTSYAHLAKQYGISKGAVGKRATKERWVDARERYGNGVYHASVAEAKSATVDRLKDLREAAEKAAGIVSARMIDCEDLSPRDLRAYAASLRDLDVLLRNFYNVPTPEQVSNQEIAKERLAIERERLKLQSETDAMVTVEFDPEIEEWTK